MGFLWGNLKLQRGNWTIHVWYLSIETDHEGTYLQVLLMKSKSSHVLTLFVLFLLLLFSCPGCSSFPLKLCSCQALRHAYWLSNILPPQQLCRLQHYIVPKRLFIKRNFLLTPVLICLCPQAIKPRVCWDCDSPDLNRHCGVREANSPDKLPAQSARQQLFQNSYFISVTLLYLILSDIYLQSGIGLAQADGKLIQATSVHDKFNVQSRVSI